MVKLFLVVPCYNEQEVLHETISRLKELFEVMKGSNLIDDQSKVLFVNDGSADKTWEIITCAHEDTPELIAGVNLAHNVGHQNALMAGISTAVDYADAIISIDADLQDDPKVIPEMVNEFINGSDIVYGVRKERKKDSFFKRNTALAFYKLMNILGVNTIYNHADFRLMSKRAVENLLLYRERNLFLRGVVPLIGFKSACVYYSRDKRFAGESKYPLSKMLNFAVDGITSFSVKPVRLVFFIGLFFVVVSFLILLYVLYSSYVLNNTTSGWASIMLSIWFVGGMVMVSIGVIGEYIGKIFIEVKDRPRYNIESVIGL